MHKSFVKTHQRMFKWPKILIVCGKLPMDNGMLPEQKTEAMIASNIHGSIPHDGSRVDVQACYCPATHGVAEGELPSNSKRRQTGGKNKTNINVD